MILIVISVYLSARGRSRQGEEPPGSLLLGGGVKRDLGNRLRGWGGGLQAGKRSVGEGEGERERDFGIFAFLRLGG